MIIKFKQFKVKIAFSSYFKFDKNKASSHYCKNKIL